MTNTEAITLLRHNLTFGDDAYSRAKNKAIQMAIEALEKQNKYKWHDLRINPEDLPTDNINDESVYFECVHENHIYDATYPCYQFYDGDWGGWEDRFNPFTLGYEDTCFCTIPDSYEKIIAWREIEPFKEDSE